MNTISCTLTEFRQVASDLLKSLPAVSTIEKLDQGVKCLALAFVGLRGTEADVALAHSVFDYTIAKVMDREAIIMASDAAATVPVTQPAATTSSLDALLAALQRLTVSADIGLLLNAARAEHAAMLKAFDAIGRSAIDAFDADSGDAEASALKEALDLCRPYAPHLSPDSEHWAI